MKIDLQIGYDDLSKECKKKIEKLRKLVGKDDITISYPDISKLIHDKGDRYPGITVPPPVPFPGKDDDWEWKPGTGIPRPILCETKDSPNALVTKTDVTVKATI